MEPSALMGRDGSLWPHDATKPVNHKFTENGGRLDVLVDGS